MDDDIPEWSYANNWRIIATFLGLAGVFLGLGLLAVLAFGDEAGFAGVSLLTIATFLLVFSVLVFLPRLARRGTVSFSLFSRRSVEDAERAVREAIEEAGRAPRVEVAKSRSESPSRIVTADGIPARFRIEVTHTRQRTDDGREWTEIIQSITPTDEGEARALRERITARLSEAMLPKE